MRDMWVRAWNIDCVKRMRTQIPLKQKLTRRALRFYFCSRKQLQSFLQEIKIAMTFSNSNVRIQTLRADPCVEQVDQRVVDWPVGLGCH